MSHSDHTGRHPVHVAHLVMGVAFMGYALVWLLHATGTASHHDLRWLLPLPWVAAGAIGLVAAAVAGHHRHAADQSDAVTVSDGSATPDPDSEEPR